MAWVPRLNVTAYFHIYWLKQKILFNSWVEKGCTVSLHVACESKLKIHFI